MPSPWIGLIIAMSAYRVCRLAGWDEFPLVERVRAWVIGETWTTVIVPDLIRVKLAEGEKLADHVSQFPVPAMQEIGRSEDAPLGPDADTLGLPGKQPHSDVDDVRPSYSRPTLAHLVHCPFCLGWWVSLAHVIAWYAWHPTIYGMFPFAVSGFVGLVAKNLDA